MNLPKLFLVRTVLFPKSRLSLAAAREMAEELNERVTRLALNFNAKLIKPDPNWYGADPIHIHRRHRDHAWQHILSPWKTTTTNDSDLSFAAPRLPLSRCRPHVRRLFGIEQRRQQPAVNLPSGTRVSFF